jgi:hypothetical protein
VQLRADNAINTVEPQLVDPAHGNFRPVTTGNVFTVAAYPIPSFPGGDRPSPPLSPAGHLTNLVGRNAEGGCRYRPNPPGAYTGGSGMRMDILMSSSNAVTVRLLGERGYDYRIDVSSNLLNWTALVTTNAASVTNDVLDALSAGHPVRFYRAILR